MKINIFNRMSLRMRINWIKFRFLLDEFFHKKKAKRRKSSDRSDEFIGSDIFSRYLDENEHSSLFEPELSDGNVSDEDKAYYMDSRFAETVVNVDDAETFKSSTYLMVDDNRGNTIRVSITEGTHFLEVEESGLYNCIYSCSFNRRTNKISGRVVCVVNPKLYSQFSSVTDVYTKCRNIECYATCSPEQQQLLLETANRKAYTPEDTKVNALMQKRDINTSPDYLRMMYEMCKHTLPANIQTDCKELLKKLESRSSNAAILADILYCCCENEPNKPFLSTEECEEVFKSHRYGDTAWSKDIIRQLRLLDRCDDKGTVIVLVGPPGTGKTRFAEILSLCTNKPLAFIDCLNKNAMEIGGAFRTYADSRHGLVQEALLEYGKKACIVLDEFDKMTINEKEGNPYSFFTSAFDDRKYIKDAFTNVPVSTKDVIWILTVNYIENVPEYILNRFYDNIFILDGYSVEDKAEIGKRFLAPQSIKQYKFSDKDIRFTDEGLKLLAASTDDEGARRMGYKIVKVLGVANQLIENGHSDTIVVDADFANYVLGETSKTLDKHKVSTGFSV